MAVNVLKEVPSRWVLLVDINNL